MVVHVQNRPWPDSNQGSLELMEEYIRLRAYQLYEERGRLDGHDLEDWLAAEAEILGVPSIRWARPHRADRARAA